MGARLEDRMELSLDELGLDRGRDLGRGLCHDLDLDPFAPARRFVPRALRLESPNSRQSAAPASTYW
jgi:hypothetical protein